MELQLQRNKIFSLSLWEKNSPRCKRDLIIKGIAVSVILLMNLALLGTALYFIVQFNLPIPGKALVTSPFIVGILVAITQLKLPILSKSSLKRLGISRGTYSDFSNPLNLLGLVAAFCLFFPYKIAYNACDWTQYHDRGVANEIMEDLFDEIKVDKPQDDKTYRSFEVLAEEYGKHFKNLAKYGFIPSEDKGALIQLYKDYKPIRRDWKRLGQKGLIGDYKVIELGKVSLKKEVSITTAMADLKKEQEGIEKRWATLRETIRIRPSQRPTIKIRKATLKRRTKLIAA